MPLTSINPTTGETIRTFEELTDEQLEQKLEAASRAFRERRSGSLAQRAAAMKSAARILETEKKALGRLMVEEMGKPFSAAISEAEKCARACQHYAENAGSYLADEPLRSEATESYIRYLPIGPVLAIMPWNFPFWQVFRFAAPALMAGNVGLLKHAANVTQCALAIEDILRRAGFPEGVFQTLLVGSERVEAIIQDPRVRAVTLTGSDATGAKVASEAGKELKKAVLELGGSDPFIVMPSADLDAAVRVGITARNINNGQSCIAAKRFIIHKDVYEEFQRRFIEGLRKLKVGDPMREGTDLGPLATQGVLENLDRQVRRSVERGARLLLGGKPLGGRGYFYPATALASIPKDSPAYQEEVFGPVALLFEARDLDHAIQLANDSPYGLGSSAWTNEAAEEERFVNEIEAGQVFINAMVASDPRLPFGGVKRSGYGRELHALGMREFLNIKTVYVNRKLQGT
jgi:succinate-semialdehyde dehydrogenase/glutarate-semialdehyde dehydrogenase